MRKSSSLPRLHKAVSVVVRIMLLVALTFSWLGQGVTSAKAASTTVVISQIYGGGGNTGATYRNDYIELYNLGMTSVNLNGMSVQYASETGTTWTVLSLPNTNLPAGKYFLLQLGSGGANGIVLPTSDAAFTTNISANAGKIALVNSTTALSGACPSSSSIVDLVGYGTNPSCYETVKAVAHSNTTALFRINGGATDTDKNSTDFSTGTPNPRNTASETAPVVTGVTPGVNASNVAIDSDIIVTFNEAVTTNGAWATISCTSSGSHLYATASAVNVFTINPDTDFTANETCTITVVATQVADQDSNDPPDTMLVNFSWSFTTIVAETAPSVSSTVPNNNTAIAALNSDLSLTFSEPVNVTGAWYGIACTSSGAHTAAVSGGPTTFTINPDSDFVYNETCTVTIQSAQVSDQDAIDPPDAMAGNYVWSFTTPVTTNPAASGAAAPPKAIPGGSTLLAVTVTPGTNPASTGLTVTADLSPIGGSSTQTFYDNATNGDATPGDNIFSYQATVSVDTTVNSYSLPVSISDAQSRSAATSISLEVAEPNLVVISQVYGDGGNSGAVYTHDYIELYNRSLEAVDITGWTLQYASATGTTWSRVATLSGVIQPGQYYLIRGAAGSGCSSAPCGAVLPVNPDLIAAQNISGTAGKLALVTDYDLVTTACPLNVSADVSRIADFVGYGTTANCSEGGAKAPTPNTAIFRNGNGSVDTNNNTNDFTAASPNPRGSSGSAELAPQVTAVTPAPGASLVSLTTNIVVDFSEAVNVSGAWYTIVCDTSGSHTGAVTGGPLSFTINPSVDFVNNEKCTATIVAAQVTDQDANDPPDNMTADYTWSFTTPGASVCEQSFTPIYDIQGSGATSPFANAIKTTVGIVTADWQATGQMGGYYIQAQGAGDNDPATSDGVFIYDTSNAVAQGDLVRVTGTVVEYNGMTEIKTVTARTVCSTGNTLPAPVTANLPESTNGELERYEGMLIHIPQTLYINQNYFLGRYGQLTLSVDSDGAGADYNEFMYYPTNGNFTSNTAANNATRILILDDASSSQNRIPTPYLNPTTHTNRIGDSIAGLTGILDQGAINSSTPAAIDFRLQPTVEPVITFQNSRTAEPAVLEGNLKISTFNVLNYFNGNGSGGGFPTSRGATNLTEFNRQRAKIIAALQAIDADIVGLMEIENDGNDSTSAIQDLVNGLNAAMGAGTYDFIHEPSAGAAGTDQIKVGMIYKPAKVTPFEAAQYYQTNAGGYTPLFDRPPLVQTFSLNENGEKFTVIVNHFKSRRCDSATGLDLDQGDGQGCYNAKRTAQATELVNLINSLTAIDPDVLVIGDLNAYLKEAPLNVLTGPTARPVASKPNAPTGGGLVSLTADFVPADQRYSYVFDGWLGELDHALATPHMRGLTTGATIWHINSTEPSLIDYNLEYKTTQDFYSATPYRSSDHDPVVMMFQVNNPTAVTVTGFEATPIGPGLKLTWRTENSFGILGFNLYRSLPGGSKQRLNDVMIPVINPSQMVLSEYSVLDSDILPGTTCDYWLEIITPTGGHMMQPLTVTILHYMFIPMIRK
jgi:predicted extracellular nuclease